MSRKRKRRKLRQEVNVESLPDEILEYIGKFFPRCLYKKCQEPIPLDRKHRPMHTIRGDPVFCSSCCVFNWLMDGDSDSHFMTYYPPEEQKLIFR